MMAGFGHKVLSCARAALVVLLFVLFGSLSYSVATLIFSSDVDVVAVTCVSDAVFALLCWFASGRDLGVEMLSPSNRRSLWFIPLLLSPVVWLVGVLGATWVNSSFSDVFFSTRNVVTSGSSPALIILLSLVLAPLVEEMVCRGICWSFVREHCGPVFTSVMTSVLFAVMHGSFTHLPHTFLIGCLLCLMLEQGLPLIACVGVHSALNAASLWVTPHVKVPDVFVSMPLVGLLWFGVLFALLLLIYVSGRDALPAKADEDMEVTSV